MKSPFPSPSIKYLPGQFSDDPQAAALAAALDRAVSQVSSDLLGMRDWNNPESCPAAMLDELAYEIGVTVNRTDQDSVKRAKVVNGIRSQKYNSTWAKSAKLAVDAVTGYSSVLWTSPQSDWPVRIGDGLAYAAGMNWMLRGGTSPADDYTIIRIGSGFEAIVPGNVFVDVGTSGLTTEQVAQVVAALDDIVPAYMRVTIGYTTAGVFSAYPNGVMG